MYASERMGNHRVCVHLILRRTVRWISRVVLSLYACWSCMECLFPDIFTIFFNFCILMAIKWYLVGILIFISLLSCECEYLYGMLAFGDSFPASTPHVLENLFSQYYIPTSSSFLQGFEESCLLCVKVTYKLGSMSEVSILFHACSIHLFWQQSILLLWQWPFPASQDHVG